VVILCERLGEIGKRSEIGSWEGGRRTSFRSLFFFFSFRPQGHEPISLPISYNRELTSLSSEPFFGEVETGG
jgi:hypothetical protein